MATTDVAGGALVEGETENIALAVCVDGFSGFFFPFLFTRDLLS